MLEAYREHVAEREALGIPPKPLNPEQVADLVELLKNPPAGEEETLVYLLETRVPPGVDEAAYVKAAFLSAIVKGEATSPLISKEKAVQLLGMMQGGYNIETLVDLLDDSELAKLAGEELKHTLLMFDAFNDVKEKMDAGNAVAKDVIESWANAEWFTSKKKVPESTKMVVFKVTGETNTDDLSPAQDAWSRPDIPLHARAAYKMERDGLNPEEPGVTGPMSQIDEIKSKGLPVAFVGDVVGTGSSRKSATNSVLWFFGEDIPGVPNKRAGGVCIGNKVAPICFNTMEDAGALVFEAPVDDMNMGDVIEIRPYEGKILNEAGETISEFSLKSDVILDEVQAGGRIPLIIGRGLTNKAREALGLGATDIFRLPKDPEAGTKGFTLGQKMVGKACGLEEGQGVRPGTYCEPEMTTVGSQDTTGPMTRDELKDLACLGFQADLVMQSFCHTASSPAPVRFNVQHPMPVFPRPRRGVSLSPRDRLLLPSLPRPPLPHPGCPWCLPHTLPPRALSLP
ncbi:MAG: aconitate hydratase B, partial [Alteromonadaceae bacterium]|nr:aconitate hydratase B [Alteromonadaceae bacterium]